MKNKVQLFKPIFYILIGTAAAMACLALARDVRLFYASASVLLLGISFALLKMLSINKELQYFLNQLGDQINSLQRDSMIEFPLPVLVSSPEGEILWFNDRCRAMLEDPDTAFGQDVSQVVGEIDYHAACPEKGFNIRYRDRMYSVYTSVAEEKRGGMVSFYFVDDNDLKKYTAEFFQTRPAVLSILIDNYEELVQSAKEDERSQAVSEVEYEVSRFVRQNDGMFIRVERDRFLAVIEERNMKQSVDGRFEILDRVRGIVAGDRMPATLSIGVARDGGSFLESEKMARQALDMALGRGGDQAAIKTQNGYDFFGGVAKGVEKRTKVKTRIVATALCELIENSERVIVMGHRFADMDSFGAAVGMLKLARNMGKPAVVAISHDKNLVQPLYRKMEENGYTDAFYEPKDLIEGVTDKTLLIVVDTHIEYMLESPELYRQCKNVVVIDHHRKMVGHIDNAVIFYHEPYASSASEMVTELAQYFNTKQQLGRVEAEAVLAGIMLDTKNFIIGTGARTFEAAAYLRKLGADMVEVRKLFSTSMDDYQNRSKLVSSAEIYRGCAIASSSAGVGDIKIVAPQAADELLSISDVDASFVLYEYDGGVSMSARSLGAMNVQLIMEALGGGGHQTMAGAQLAGVSMENARQQLLEAIDNFYDKRS